jgi:hypothetical protein
MTTHPVLTRALESGALEDLRAVSEWWASGLYARSVDPEIARTLVAKGATVSVHAAAGLGMTDHLERMLAADPSLIDAKGCDACTPLHFARDVATASLLLDHGARKDARDEDHESTPAQWLMGDTPGVARFLLDRGAAPDIFMAAALGDQDLAARLIDANPRCVAQRIGRPPEFPPIGHNGRGGSIYQWTLAFNSYPHQIALRTGNSDLFDRCARGTPISSICCGPAATRRRASWCPASWPGAPTPRRSPPAIPASSPRCLRKISSCCRATAGRPTPATTR